jgi:diguanylate cyclase (GGDEF) domain
MNLKAKGMVFSLIVIILTILVLGGSTYLRFRSILVNETDEAVERVAYESADHINSYINQFVVPLVGLSENDKIRSMNWEDQKQVIKNQINPQYQDVAIVDLVGMAHYTDDKILNLSDRDYIKSTLAGNISFSDVITSRKTGDLVIMVGVPIFCNKCIAGALIARLDADFLSEFALTRGYGKNGRAYIISSQGTFISKQENGTSQVLNNIFQIVSMNHKYASFSTFVKESSIKNQGSGKYKFEGKNILVGYATVKQTQWKIYIGTYENEILKSLNGLRKMLIIIFGGTLIISSIAAWVFVSKFTKPIVELDHLFSQGARGDLTIRFTPKTKDEIGRVGISFNRMMDKIKTLTQYDPLTGLLNQYVLEKDIDSIVHSEEINDFSLIMVAIDKFGMINETYGYNLGDVILDEIAKRIAACDADNYQIYRYKGDKFVILYNENFSEADISIKAQRLLEKLMESYHIGGKMITLAISIGVFSWNDRTRKEDPLKAVTHAKNYAKYLGSNQVQVFNVTLFNKIRVSKDLQADILNGIKEDQFFLVYQPLFYLDNESMAEIEALIRWKHPEKGMLYPDQFIEGAELSGLIINIDHWVVETACKQIKTWKENGRKPVLLSINISSKTFETNNFILDLLSIIHKYDIDPSLIQLEITERMLISNVDESIQKLNELRKMGIRIAIDDFGIGYSSLSYIVRLPIDSIKIDKSFVQSMTSSKEAMAIVSTIINLCKTLKLNVIAEGIESKFELDYLKSNQCDIGQGYYFSKPVNIVDIEKHM